MSRFLQQSDSRSYRPSFFAGEPEPYLNETHRTIELAVDSIRGKLEPADHLKLYEVGFFARGPILEIGRLHGRSTAVLASGLRDGGQGHRLASIEFEDRYLAPAREHLENLGLAEIVDLLQGDSSTVVNGLDVTFDTVFVDGDHSYEGVVKDIQALKGKLADSAIVLFHDYYHPANDTGEYGVRRAVDELAPNLGLEFRGRAGGIRLYERGP